MDKLKIEIEKVGKDIGVFLDDGDNALNWNKMTRDEQECVLNCIARCYQLLSRYMKEE